jgi:hypothetical protein
MHGGRLRVAASYRGLHCIAKLTPSFYVSKDVAGYSFDGTFSEGRLTARLGLRADWKGGYYAEAQYTHFGGGKYNLLADRSNTTLIAGATF